MIKAISNGLCLFLISCIQLVNANTLPLMPYPQSLSKSDEVVKLHKNISLNIKGMSEARTLFIRPFYQKQWAQSGFHLNNKVPSSIINGTRVNVNVNQNRTQALQLPTLHQDENYQLTITPHSININADTDFGALHGLATLNQLFYFAKDSLQLPILSITDKPRFAWRGFMLDSVRHFISVNAIKRQLDGMAAAKLNVFHWHLTDDQGWRIESNSYPKLHQMASDNQYYLQTDIKAVVAYAANLGIRVVPEFDVPGHASAIAVAYPELITESKNYTMEDGWGVFEPLLDPSKPEVYQFITAIVTELTTLFPDTFLHIGGDEVHPAQWQNSEHLKAFMQANQLKNTDDIQVYFNAKVQQILAKQQRKMMGWDEIFHPDLPKDIMIQSWRGMESLSQIANAGYQGLLSTGFYIDQAQPSRYHYNNEPLKTHSASLLLNKDDQIQAWQFTMPRLKGSAVKGKLVVINRPGNKTHAYVKLNQNHYKKVQLDSSLSASLSDSSQQINFTLDSWMGPTRGEFTLDMQKGFSGQMFIGNAYYPVSAKPIANFDAEDYNQDLILPANMTPSAQQNILGGEATLWSELVTENNLDVRTWPRLFVIAERLWSAKNQTNIDDMYQRLMDINHYAQAVGLQHLSQFKQGMQALVTDNTDITPLKVLAEQLEPASYYTRHHIKYQQSLYHQNAPLNDFVDFLPVESFTLVTLHQQLSAYRQGKKTAMQAILKQLQHWQFNITPSLTLIKKSPKLTDLLPTAEAAASINKLNVSIAKRCLNTESITQAETVKIDKTLHDIHAKRNEIVVASALFTQQLLVSCQ